jgi:hypothetical protein
MRSGTCIRIIFIDARVQLVPGSHKTLERFLAGSPDDGHSLLALHAKVSVLLKKAIESGEKPGSGS